ncbi:MAG: YqgE/AlgH family protein [Gammaproteobacteria bacterium]|nr:YqgE/AlgH family protein [Gammaproteobacteria bacterium]
MTSQSQFRNQFLIAMPALQDPNFSHTVTLLCDHSHEGAMGLIINRPTSLNLGGLAAQLGIDIGDPDMANVPVYHGGPVQPEQGFILHSPIGEWDSTMEINPQLAMTVSQDIIEAIALGVGPKHFLIALGYAGWGAGQLEEEIATNAWLNSPADNQIIFSTPVDERWQAATSILGIDLNQLSNDVGHA